MMVTLLSGAMRMNALGGYTGLAVAAAGGGGDAGIAGCADCASAARWAPGRWNAMIRPPVSADAVRRNCRRDGCDGAVERFDSATKLSGAIGALGRLGTLTTSRPS